MEGGVREMIPARELYITQPQTMTILCATYFELPFFPEPTPDLSWEPQTRSCAATHNQISQSYGAPLLLEPRLGLTDPLSTENEPASNAQPPRGEGVCGV